MTREEAIKFLELDRKNRGECFISDAIDMAIKALEQEPSLDKIKAEIKEWYWQADKQKLAEDPCVVDAMISLFIRTINKYKTESEVEEMTDYQEYINALRQCAKEHELDVTSTGQINVSDLCQATANLLEELEKARTENKVEVRNEE